MSDRVDVVVIGSGYGGSAVAARVAPHARVIVLERGRIWRSGDFPTHLPGLAAAYHSRRNPLGLWGMRVAAGTGNAYASGVGGASLVNYGITQAPEDHVFDAWPLSKDALAPYYERALDVLRPTPSPLADTLGDKDFLDRVEPGRRVDLRSTIDWSLCRHCGRCVPGCNFAAKRSLDRTYLALAQAAGAEVRPEREVAGLEAAGDGWRVLVHRTGASQVDEVIPARHVVLAAGTFGTLDLLHATRGHLATTAWFGRRMTMNGDGLAFLYNTSHALSGHHGAPITTSVHIPFFDAGGHRRTLNVMSGRIPVAAMRLSALALALAAGVLGRRKGPRDAAATRAWRRFLDLVRTDPRGALAHTFMYKLDAEDSSGGHAVFDADGRSALAWPDYRQDPIVRFAASRLEDWAAKVGGVLVPDVSGLLPGMRSFGVHPLGGCRMGTSPEDGVVDTTGRVFRPDGGVHPGLRIADASIIPSSLGVPSSLTVAALGERVAEGLVADLRAAAGA